MTLRKKPGRPSPRCQLFSQPVPGAPNAFVVVERLSLLERLPRNEDARLQLSQRPVLKKKLRSNGSSNGGNGHHGK